MNILIIDKYGKGLTITSDVIPRVGDRIGAFEYQPLPVVETIIWWPSDTLLQEMGVYKKIDVLIMV